MAVLLSPVGGVAGQFFDNNGNPLSGGKMYSYVAGTTTPQVTYTSGSGATAHSNPIVLDSGGRVPGGEIWLTDGFQYKFVLKTSTDVLIGTYDNIVGINSNFVNFLTETEVQTATSGQTVFTLATTSYQPGTNTLSVFVDGVNQYDGITYAYVETSSTVVTFTAGLHVGALVKFTTAQTLSSGVTDASIVTYQPAGTGAVATTVQTKLRESVSVKDFGAVGDGVTDDTAAIQAAINSNSRIYVPEGVYITGTLNFPNVIGNTPCVFQGAGMGKTILQANSTNIALLRKVNTSGSIDGGLIGDFSVKPHASGSTNAAILCTGFRTSMFQRIQGLSNGVNGFSSLFSVSAYPWLCYRNTWSEIVMDSTQGYTYGIYFNNAGTVNAANNSNIGAIRDCWFNSNAGMSIVIYATRSAKIAIENCIFENNLVAVAIASGNTTTIKDNWFELNALDIDFPTFVDGTANDGLISGNYFSTPHNVNFYNASLGNLWLNNTEAGIQTFINNSYQNFKSKISTAANIVSPIVPTVTYNTGQTGTLTLGSALITQQINQLSGDVIMSIAATWTATIASTPTKFNLPTPTGFTFKSVTSALGRKSTGEPGIINFDSSLSFWVYNKYNDAQSIQLTIVYTRT